MIIRDDDYIRLNYISDFIEDFIAPIHRERLYFLLSKPDRRLEVMRHFDSPKCFDPRYCFSIAQDEQNSRHVYNWLKKRGAPSKCFVFSSEAELSGEFDLKVAIDKCFEFYKAQAIIYCKEAKVAYWQAGDYERECRLFCKNRKLS